VALTLAIVFLHIGSDTIVHPVSGQLNHELISHAVHILGICGTFMGGIAALARARDIMSPARIRMYIPHERAVAGHGVEIIEGYDPKQLELRPDVVVIGK